MNKIVKKYLLNFLESLGQNIGVACSNFGAARTSNGRFVAVEWTFLHCRPLQCCSASRGASNGILWCVRIEFLFLQQNDHKIKIQFEHIIISHSTRPDSLSNIVRDGNARKFIQLRQTGHSKCVLRQNYCTRHQHFDRDFQENSINIFLRFCSLIRKSFKNHRTKLWEMAHILM